jgi:hypothetical protein
VTAMTVCASPIASSAPRTAAPYGCACGHELQVYGRDRHRRYYELDDAAHLAPVMTRACHTCGRGLPGKNPG